MQGGYDKKFLFRRVFLPSKIILTSYIYNFLNSHQHLLLKFLWTSSEIKSTNFWKNISSKIFRYLKHTFYIQILSNLSNKIIFLEILSLLYATIHVQYFPFVSSIIIIMEEETLKIIHFKVFKTSLLLQGATPCHE
jgi:hypothetical protein